MECGEHGLRVINVVKRQHRHNQVERTNTDLLSPDRTVDVATLLSRSDVKVQSQ
ncbi:MAG: hypothetical protein V9F03_09030 [Microthrixaceae bacterium]